MRAIATQHRLIDPTKVYAPAPTPADGTKQHLNSTLPVNHLSAPTEFTYVVTNGSDDGIAYLKS